MTDQSYRELYDAHKARLMRKGFTEAEAHHNAGKLAESGTPLPPPKNPAGPSDEARARSTATRSRRAAAAKALAALDVIAADPNLDGSDQVALDDVRAVLSRYVD